MGKAELKIEIDAELLARMRAAGVRLDAFVEARMREALAKREDAAEDRAKAWALENAEAIREHNERIDRRGLIGDPWRKC